MKKLSLQLDALSVESFETHVVPEQRGTVMGHTQYQWMCTADVSCDYGCDTINYSCPTARNCPSDTCRVGCGPTYYQATCPPDCPD